MKTIVVSAVNIRKGGTLTILKQCLKFLSIFAQQHSEEYRIIAIVHNKELNNYPFIEYIEFPNVCKSWIRRIWCEYVTMNAISKKLSPIFLWLSLHDTTPRVQAEHMVVYCQTSFPFMKFRASDLRLDYKIALFSIFTKYIYKINVHKNDYLIVQAEWLRKGFTRMLNMNNDKFIIFPPEAKPIGEQDIDKDYTQKKFTFFYAATPDVHKNFECLCEAAKMLEKEVGEDIFQVIITIKGDECKYSRALKKKYGKSVHSLIFTGFLDKKRLNKLYWNADCLVFPSRVETWGLPISEFKTTNKPMLLADLPYSHETSSDAELVGFFNVNRPNELKKQMKMLLENDKSFLRKNIINKSYGLYVYSWNDLFNILIYNNRK